MERNPAVSGSNPDGPVLILTLYLGPLSDSKRTTRRDLTSHDVALVRNILVSPEIHSLFTRHIEEYKCWSDGADFRSNGSVKSFGLGFGLNCARPTLILSDI